MSIRRKLVYSFSILTFFLLAQFSVNFYFDQAEQDLVNSMLQVHEVSNQLSALAIATQKIRRYEKEYFINIENQARRVRYYRAFTETHKEIIHLLKSLKHGANQAGKNNLANQVITWELATMNYIGAMDRIHQSVEEGKVTKVTDADKAIKFAKNRFRAVFEGSLQAIEDANRLSLAKAGRIEQIDRNATMASAMLVLVSVLSGFVIATVIPGNIVKPLRELSEAANRISKGRINEPVEVVGSTEIVDLSVALQRLQNATFKLIKRAQNPQTRVS